MRRIALLLLLVLAASISAQTVRTKQLAIKCVSASRLSAATETIIYRDCDDGKNYISSGGAAFAELGAGPGTVTSVGLSAPSILSVSGSPVTGSGTLALALATQSANLLWAGPSSGGAATPTFRAVVKSDLPAVTVFTDQVNTFTQAQTFGTGGAAVVSHFSGTASLDYATALATTCETLTIAVTGAVQGSNNVVSLGMPTALAAHNTTSLFFAWVSADDVVSVRRCVLSSDGSNPAAATVRSSVTQY